MPKRTFVVRAGLTRNYGKHEVYYELSEQIEADSTGDVREAFLSLQSLLENQITVYEQVSLPYVQLPKGDGHSGGDLSNSESFILETITVDSQGGKKIIKAKGGKFTKYGAPVYSECSTDLPIETLGFGVHDFRHLNLTVKCDMEGGFPKRAVSIR